MVRLGGSFWKVKRLRGGFGAGRRLRGGSYLAGEEIEAGLLGKFISLVFGKKGYQEAFPFPSGTGSGSFKNIKITETSKSIAWKQVVCFTCTPFQVNWITCLCRRAYLQK